MLDKYHTILYNDKGEEVEYSDHPDMLFWMESGFIDNLHNLVVNFDVPIQLFGCA